MFHCAVSGGIASGKSVVCKILESMLHPVYYADDRASFLIDTQTEIKQQLTERFGVNIYQQDKINKPLLASLIFNSTSDREFVNSVVHPIVRKDYMEWRKLFKNKEFTFFESALIFQSDLYKYFDAIIVVDASINLRIERLILRDNISSNEAEKRLSVQINPKEYTQRADYIIINDGAFILPQLVTTINLIKDNG